jgi:hypothetical protein
LSRRNLPAKAIAKDLRAANLNSRFVHPSGSKAGFTDITTRLAILSRGKKPLAASRIEWFQLFFCTVQQGLHLKGLRASSFKEAGLLKPDGFSSPER